MGGLFGSPSAPAPAAETVVEENTEEEEAREERLEDMARRRRGRSSTISTSDRGLFSQNDWVPRRKSLLGE